MNDFVKQYSSRIQKPLILLIRLLLQEQKQSDEDLHSLLMMDYLKFSDYHTVSNPKTFLLFTKKNYHNVIIQL